MMKYKNEYTKIGVNFYKDIILSSVSVQKVADFKRRRLLCLI
ncbi:hypothetical protein [Clostridium sp. UBA7503]